MKNKVSLRPTVKKLTVQCTALNIQEYATKIKSILKWTIWALPVALEQYSFSECVWTNFATYQTSPKRTEYARDTESIKKPMFLAVRATLESRLFQ